MIKKIKSLYQKYKTIILYIFFGGITTLINYIVYFFVDYILQATNPRTTIIATGIAWIAAVCTAFITNKLFVFDSKDMDKKTLAKEIIPFFAARAISFILDATISVIGINYIGAHKLIVKIIANVIVLVFNYLASKLFIFKKE